MMTKTRGLKDKDWKTISVYLDGQLSKKQEAAFEVRLTQETELRDALRQIQWTKSVLRKAPHRKVPHHFILTHQMAAEAKRQKNSVIRQYGLVSGIASLTFILLAGIQLLPFFKMGMAPNLAMAPKEVLMEESVMMDAEIIEEYAAGEPVQMQEEPAVEAEFAQEVETADMMAEVAEEAVIEEEPVESAAVGESEQALNETTEMIEEEQTSAEGGELSLTTTPVPTENLIKTPIVDATSVKLAEEHDDCMEGSAPRAEETVELTAEEELIERDGSTDEDEDFLDQSSIETDKISTMQLSALETLTFIGMVLSALIAIISLVAVFRKKYRS